ncbi:DUF3772 domain-containing protein [Methylococcus geothermalis]|uniref:DUF3772 domain-containing protein n=1 Tax=Methylococcus geothermalis TaxID=2681310 RepID=UPI001E3D1BA2|nr:DUF3772 domain-containing protein [Methylococcus geothermalis]
MNLLRIIQSLPLLLAAIFAPACSFAQEPAGERPLAAQVKDWQALLDRYEKTLAKGDLDDDRLVEIRAELGSLRLDARAAADQARPLAQAIRDELAALGPPPGEGEPPEAPGIAAKRKAISERLANMEGSLKEAELVITRADGLAERLQSLRRTRFTERVLTRGPSPLFPSVWRKAFQEIREAAAAQRQDFEDWLARDSTAAKIDLMRWQLPLAVLVAVLIAWPLRLWFIRRFGYVEVTTEPSYGQRLRTALVTGIIRTLIPSAAVLAIYLGFTAGGLLSDSVRYVVQPLATMLVVFFFVVACCRAALAPGEPLWRLISLGDDSARVIAHIVTAMTAVFAIDAVVNAWGKRFEWSVELMALHNFVTGLSIALLLLIILRRRIWESEVGTTRWLGLRYTLTLLVYAIPIAALPGYVVLSRLLAIQLVLSIGLYVLVTVLGKIGDEFVSHMLSERAVVGRHLRSNLDISPDGIDALSFWLTGLARLCIGLTGILALMVLWGAGGSDLSAWLYEVVFGFKIGNITVSLADLAFGLLLFAGMLILTRFVQRTLEHRILPRTRIDPGLQHSIRTAVGYLGFTLALIMLISAAGFDLSQLTIIAGALSVGIGLGFQNVVNNFVSGLILLAERPIKVGDWIMVGDVQGYVKKISVRATEVLTFDRASVFIPNSELIAHPVTNRTYADKVGRIVIPVSFSYGTDARKVCEVLMQVAKSHPKVLRQSGPFVFFKEFGPSSLNFEVIAFVADVDTMKSVTSELCIEIDAACRLEGLTMPYPQRDVHLDIDQEQLSRLLAGLSAPQLRPAAPGVLPSDTA